jgi:hypothetical protein
MTESKSPIAPEQARAIADEVRKIEISDTEAWTELDVLSSDTGVESIEVFEDEIRSKGDRFEGPINVHVVLRYPKNVTLSETFPGRFEGSWEGEKPSIDRLLVDTSSFTS